VSSVSPSIWDDYGWQIGYMPRGYALWTNPRIGVAVPLPAPNKPPVLKTLDHLTELIPALSEDLLRSNPLRLPVITVVPDAATAPVKLLVPDAAGPGLVGSLPGGLPAAVPALPSLPALGRR
jgi:hypothetical protein